MILCQYMIHTVNSEAAVKGGRTRTPDRPIRSHRLDTHYRRDCSTYSSSRIRHSHNPPDHLQSRRRPLLMMTLRCE